MARVFLLALRPHLSRFVRIVLVGLDEVEAATRGGAVLYGDPHAIALSLDRQDQRASVVAPGHRLSVDSHRLNVEADGVESELVGGRIDAARVDDRLGVNALRRDFERDVQGQVAYGEWPIRLEVARAGRERERAPGGRSVFCGAGTKAAAARVQAVL